MSGANVFSVGVAGLDPARFDNSKDTRIGLPLFYTSEYKPNISNNYSIIIFFSTVSSS